jgi:hypothetical protein
MPKFTLCLAYDTCVYGIVEVEADSLPDAVETVRADHHHGSGADEFVAELWDQVNDVDHSTAINYRVCYIRDEDGTMLLGNIPISEADSPASLSKEEVLALLTANRISN